MIKEVQIRNVYKSLFSQWLEDFKKTVNDFSELPGYDVSTGLSRMFKKMSSRSQV